MVSGLGLLLTNDGTIKATFLFLDHVSLSVEWEKGFRVLTDLFGSLVKILWTASLNNFLNA